jgi:hypothetical protein
VKFSFTAPLPFLILHTLKHYPDIFEKLPLKSTTTDRFRTDFKFIKLIDETFGLVLLSKKSDQKKK